VLGVGVRLLDFWILATDFRACVSGAASLFKIGNGQSLPQSSGKNIEDWRRMAALKIEFT
jgi:hypothetical protein